MENITQCKGENCIIKEFCYRYYCESSKEQSYFPNSPWDGKRCEMFYVHENNVEELLLTIKNKK